MKKYILIFTFLLLASFLRAATVDTLKVFSPSMNKEIKTVVIIPDGYSAIDYTYPVLYLLHGYSGNYATWVNYSSTKTLADDYKMIIVCPDGGYSSWYLDSPVDPSVKYETFVSKELIERIDHDYSTVKSSAGRAITGLSMGGHGGLYLAFRHQDVFGAAGSMSGGVDIRPFPKNWDMAKRLGPIDTNPENWEKNSVINLVDLVKDSKLAIIFDCGVNDFFLEVNRNLHKKLVDLKIPHDYIERPGGHTGEYWNNSVNYQALFFHRFFSKK
jgi:S-formylglutathione hydrolase FrmB